MHLSLNLGAHIIHTTSFIQHASYKLHATTCNVLHTTYYMLKTINNIPGQLVISEGFFPSKSNGSLMSPEIPLSVRQRSVSAQEQCSAQWPFCCRAGLSSLCHTHPIRDLHSKEGNEQLCRHYSFRRVTKYKQKTHCRMPLLQQAENNSEETIAYMT